MRQTTSARQAVRVPPIKMTRPARASRPRQGAARSFLSLSDWSKADLTACLALAARVKTARAEGIPVWFLPMWRLAAVNPPPTSRATSNAGWTPS